MKKRNKVFARKIGKNLPLSAKSSIFAVENELITCR